MLYGASPNTSAKDLSYTRATCLFAEQRLGGGPIWEALDSDGGLELDGGLICFGGCAPGTPLFGDCVLLVEASVP